MKVRRDVPTWVDLTITYGRVDFFSRWPLSCVFQQSFQIIVIFGTQISIERDVKGMLCVRLGRQFVFISGFLIIDLDRLLLCAQ